MLATIQIYLSQYSSLSLSSTSFSFSFTQSNQSNATSILTRFHGEVILAISISLL
nr:MAG TPA: hypothetical protein [Caudoviricetes sp.]